MIKRDLEFKAQCFYGRSNPMNLLKILFTDGTSTVVRYRIARFFRKLGVGFLGWIFLEINKVSDGCVIGRSAEFDEGFVIMHGQGVVINGGVKGGKNIVLESGVVLGAARNGLPVEVPVLGNNIFIGSGAKVLGGIRIGNNVKIGANAVVIKDVPDNVTVAGIPATIVKIQQKVIDDTTTNF